MTVTPYHAIREYDMHAADAKPQMRAICTSNCTEIYALVSTPPLVIS